MTTNNKFRLKILKSDLADSNNPAILKKYPHLDNEKNREQLRKAIKEMETRP